MHAKEEHREAAQEMEEIVQVHVALRRAASSEQDATPQNTLSDCKKDVNFRAINYQEMAEQRSLLETGLTAC